MGEALSISANYLSFPSGMPWRRRAGTVDRSFHQCKGGGERFRWHADELGLGAGGFLSKPCSPLRRLARWADPATNSFGAGLSRSIHGAEDGILFAPGGRNESVRAPSWVPGLHRISVLVGERPRRRGRHLEPIGPLGRTSIPTSAASNATPCSSRNTRWQSSPRVRSRPLAKPTP
jgi:hypothetical protein